MIRPRNTAGGPQNLHSSHALNYLPIIGRDQRAAGVGIDRTTNRTTAAPLHPIVRLIVLGRCSQHTSSKNAGYAQIYQSVVIHLNGSALIIFEVISPTSPESTSMATVLVPEPSLRSSLLMSTQYTAGLRTDSK